MLVAYRIAYGLILAVFLANVVRSTNYHVWPVHATALLVTAALTICGLFVLLVSFSRIPLTIFWLLVMAWELLFVWYAWFSPVAPFALHEFHTLDKAAMAREGTTHQAWAGVIFAVLFVWFLSFPLARSAFMRGE